MSDIVKLTVGGIVFGVTKSTLMRDPESMLATMIQQPNEIQQINNGQALFVDRDGTHFNYVLNYLRDGDKTVLPFNNHHVCQLLSQEADFYQLPGLIDLIKRGSILKIGDKVKVRLNEEGIEYLNYAVSFSAGLALQRFCWICNEGFHTTSVRLADYTTGQTKYESFSGEIIDLKQTGKCAVVQVRKMCLLNVYYPGRLEVNDSLLTMHIPLAFLKLM